MDKKDTAEKFSKNLVRLQCASMVALLEMLGAVVPKEVYAFVDKKTIPDAWIEYDAALKEIVDYVPPTAEEIYRNRKKPNFLPPKNPTPEMREMERLYQSGKLVIYGKLIRPPITKKELRTITKRPR